MFVRAKRVGSRSYLYLVEGRRDGKRVRHKTLCYLGPLWKLTAGVPETIRTRVDARLDVDWKKVNRQIERLPLTFEELLEARRDKFAASVATRVGRQRRPSQGSQPRTEGEPSALAKLAADRFRQLFEETGALTYRMV